MKKRNAKKIIAIMAGCIALIVLIAVIGCNTKRGVKALVTILEKRLEINAEEHLLSSEDGTFLGFLVDSHEEDGRKSVFYEMHLFDAWGFYYVKDGEPIGYQGDVELYELRKSDMGWIWDGGQFGYSGYWYYTERIVGNWYWFEMHY